MSRRTGSTKRNREFPESTDTSQDSFPSDISRAKKNELLKKAKKKARKVNKEAETDSCRSIKDHFSAVNKDSVGQDGMATGASSSVTGVSSSDAGQSTGVELCNTEDSNVSHKDIMKKLCHVCDQLNTLNSTVLDLRGEIFELRVENDQLKKDLSLCRKREEKLEESIKEAKFQASVAENRVNDLEQYTRRNNVRVLGVSEGDAESAEDCEKKVLKIINDKLELPVKSGDIEAVHRIGRREHQGRGQTTRPRQIIVRFVSRKDTEAVLRNRRKLKRSGIVIVEDLTHENFVLLNKCRDHPGVADAWTRRGTIYVKTVKDSRVIKITKTSDLQCVPGVPTSTPLPSDQRRRLTSPMQSGPSPVRTNTGDKGMDTDNSAHGDSEETAVKQMD